MRIFAKRSFQFDHPAGEEPAVVVQMSSFADVPDWVEDSTMFKLASEDEDVTVIESKQDEINAELNADKTKKSKNKNDDGSGSGEGGEANQ